MGVRLVTQYNNIKDKNNKIDKNKIQLLAEKMATKNNVSYKGDAITKINDVYKSFLRN